MRKTLCSMNRAKASAALASTRIIQTLDEIESRPVGEWVWHVAPRECHDSIMENGVLPNTAHGVHIRHWQSKPDTIHFWSSYASALVWHAFEECYGGNFDIYRCKAPQTHERDSHWEVGVNAYKTYEPLTVARGIWDA